MIYSKIYGIRASEADPYALSRINGETSFLDDKGMKELKKDKF